MKYFTTFFLLLFTYLMLAGFTLYELILGSIISGLLSIFLTRILNIELDVFFPWKLIKFIFIYFPIFMFQLISSNIDMAKRVIQPKIPLNPGIIKLKTKMKSKLGKLTLANSITLTPGTLSLDIEEDDIIIHTVDFQKQLEIHQKGDDIFERVLGGIFR